MLFMDIAKSTRHSHITGRFAEMLVLYWLSRDGFECTRVDHTGIDLLAENCRTGELMGISVKSRSRYAGSESVSLTWKPDYRKVDRACLAFRCKPYYAIVVDVGGCIRLFLLSKEHFMSVTKQGERTLHWGMTQKYLDKYRGDPEIKCVELAISVGRWWKEPRRHST
jgi:hypothetical protein